MSFYNSYDKLLNRISELEDKIEKLSSNETLKTDYGITTHNKKLLNFRVLKQRTLNFLDLDNQNKKQLFFQLKVKFLNNLNQQIQFKLFADKILISQELNNYKSGLNEVTIYANYQNLISEKIKLELIIQSRDGLEVIVNETTLNIWGLSEESTEDYEAILFDDQIYLGYINNNRLYYKIFEKNNDCESVDFNYLNNAKAHSVCTDHNSLFLFRVDVSGALFYSKFSEEEQFISNNVSDVGCCYANDKIIFTYTSNGNVFCGEIYNNVISNNQLTNPHGYFSKCHLHYNKFNNKCYLLLTKSDNSNYLLESIDNSFHSSENICAEINLNINQQES